MLCFFFFLKSDSRKGHALFGLSAGLPAETSKQCLCEGVAHLWRRLHSKANNIDIAWGRAAGRRGTGGTQNGGPSRKIAICLLPDVFHTRRRRFALEPAAARVCREAGARVVSGTSSFS